MTLEVYFDAREGLWDDYRVPLVMALAEAQVDARLSDAAPDPGRVDAIIYAPGGAVKDFTPFTRARAVFSLWAGVERIVGAPGLTMPLCRMVDPGLTDGMVEYVAGHVLRYHLGIDRDLEGQDGVWRPRSVPLARERRVTVLGLGALGRAAAEALVGLGFRVAGWSRSPREVPGVSCHSGPGGLEAALAGAEIVVTLLPQTPETEGLVDAHRLALLARGACLINPGRGALIDDDALLAALETGQVARATLDVFRTEPLPADHPYWAHPRVTVTPHIAAETRPETAVQVIAGNLRRLARGEPLLHRVSAELGY